MYHLDGRKVLLTGGATGIGRRIATRLAEEGCDIGIIDINLAEAEITRSLVAQIGRRCTLHQADVGDFEQVSGAVDAFLEAHGRIDILANNAGVIALSRLEDMAPEDWRRIFDVNVNGVFHLCKAVVPHLKARRSGRIVNMASWFGKRGQPYYSAYCATKFAIIGITQSLALELAPLGINVNAVCPGTIIETPMRTHADARAQAEGVPTAKERETLIPLGRLGLPDDVARAVAFLASDEAAYMTGQALNASGGLWMN